MFLRFGASQTPISRNGPIVADRVDAWRVHNRGRDRIDGHYGVRVDYAACKRSDPPTFTNLL